MTQQELQERLEKEPFEPFRINTSDGKHYDIGTPRLVVPMATRVFIAFPDDRWTLIILRHVTSLESVQAA
jgi:hypothetical protein